MKKYSLLFIFFLTNFSELLSAAEDYGRALKRAQYVLTGSLPTARQIQSGSAQDAYKERVREFLEDPRFYDALLRFHEKLFQVGLPYEYLDELLREDIDFKTHKFAVIQCASDTTTQRLSCQWADNSSSQSNLDTASCPSSWQEPASAFWYPGVTAWVCPSILRACGSDLSRCFIEYTDDSLAMNTELGTTEAFDSRYAIVKSLGKQPAGLATAVVIANYPYTKILEPGLTAVDGAIAHFYRQAHHFDYAKLNLSDELLAIIDDIPLTHTQFQLVYTGTAYEQGGILSTFGWLRRYEKNRSRANQLYKKLLCRQFTSELPRIFPQDPGNLRETPGCSGCHATLDPLADFFKSWGEGGELYGGPQDTVHTNFAGKSGLYLSDLAEIIRTDNAFATCSVENAWSWLMGRGFYADESALRAALTDYFITTGYSFKELLFAVATHPAFAAGERGSALVEDPLSEPPLGEPPGGNDLPPCPDSVSFASDISPKLAQCTRCHTTPAVGGANQSLSNETEWRDWARQAISFMASGQMPPSGGAGPPRIGPVWELKEAVRCWADQEGL